MAKAGIVFVAALAVVASAAAQPERVSPGKFVAVINGQVLNQQHDRLYNELVPQQQALVSRDLFDNCMEKSFRTSNIPSDTRVSRWRTIDVLHVTITIPGTRARARSTVVMVKLTLTNGTSTQQSNDTYHLFIVRGHWRWMLDVTGMRAYKAKRCPR